MKRVVNAFAQIPAPPAPAPASPFLTDLAASMRRKIVEDAKIDPEKKKRKKKYAKQRAGESTRRIDPKTTQKIDEEAKIADEAKIAELTAERLQDPDQLVCEVDELYDSAQRSDLQDMADFPA